MSLSPPKRMAVGTTGVYAGGDLHVEKRVEAMPRGLKQDERFMRWAQERSQLFLALRNASIPEKLRAYKQLEKRILEEARSDYERREMQRRISMDLLMAASAGPWRGFSPYLRRLERLGYTSMLDRLLACVLAAEAARGSPAGVRKAVSLIDEIERRLRGRKLHPGVREEFEGGLARARKFLGLGPETTLETQAVAGQSPSLCEDG